MSNLTRLPANVSEPSVGDPDPDKVADAIRLLLTTLSTADRERVVQQIAETINPPHVPKAGRVLATIVRLFQERPNSETEVTVQDVKARVEAARPGVTDKEIYNALGYLTRRNHIRRVGYGRYLVDGALLITSDDLGSEPTRNED